MQKSRENNFLNISGKKLIKTIVITFLLPSSYVYSSTDQSNLEIKNKPSDFIMNWGFNSISAMNAYKSNYTGNNIYIGLVDADLPSGISALNKKLNFIHDKYDGYSHDESFMITKEAPSHFDVDYHSFGVKNGVIIAGYQSEKGIIGIASDAKIYAQLVNNNLHSLIEDYPVRIINHNGTLEIDLDYDVSNTNYKFVKLNNIDNTSSSIITLNYKKHTEKNPPLSFLTSEKLDHGLTIKDFVDIENNMITLNNGKKIMVNIRHNSFKEIALLHSIKAASKNNILNVFPVGDFNHYNQPGTLAGLPVVYPELIANTLTVSNIVPVRSRLIDIKEQDNIFITSQGDKYQYVDYHNKKYLREVNLAFGEIDYLWDLKNNQLVRTNIILNDEFTKKTLNITSSQCGYGALWCVSAPGTEIYSTTLRTSKNDDQKNLVYEDYDYSSGSSLSAAHTSGAAAVLMQRFPYMDAGNISLVLKTTATDLDENGVVQNTPKIIDRYFGWGEINLAKALNGPSMFVSANDVKTMLAEDLKNELGDSLNSLANSFGNGTFIANIQQGAIYDENTPRERMCDAAECLSDKWDNDISGSGGLIKRGAGTLELAGKNNTYTGTTEVEEGKLIISGSIHSDVNVYDTATLSGNGSARHLHIYRGGTFAPAQQGQISTFTIDGDITFDQNSTFSAKLAPITNQIDQLTVTGRVYIHNSAINLYQQEPDKPLTAYDMQDYQGKHYTFITANKGIEGEFSSENIHALKTNNVSPEIFKSSDTNAYHLIFAQQNKTATTLTDLNNKINLHHSEFTSYADAIQQKAKSASTIYSNIIAEQFNNHRRVREKINEQVQAGKPQTDSLHTWASILHNSSYAENYTHHHHGLLIGSNKMIDNWSAGMVGAYIDGNLEDKNHNSAHQYSHHIGGYIEYSKDNWSLLNGATYAFDQHKIYVTDKYDGQFTANYHSHSAQFFTALSKQFSWKTVQIEPMGSLSYTSIWSPSITQSNGFYQLGSSKSRNDVLSSSVGANMTKIWKLSDTLTIKTLMGAAWLNTYGETQHTGSFQYKTNNPLINNQINGAQNTIPMIKNGTQLQAGASIPLGLDAEISLKYKGLLFSQYQEHGGALNIGWYF